MVFPRFQTVIIPVLRQALPEDVTVSSWVNDIDYRHYPIVNIRRLGGYRDRDHPSGMDHPVMEMTVIHNEGLIEAEELYAQSLDALFAARHGQIVVDNGSIAYVKETMGMTQFSSLFQDTWRVQGLIQVGIRPLRKEVANGA